MTAAPRDDLCLRPAARNELGDVLALYSRTGIGRETPSLTQAQALFDRMARDRDTDLLVAVDRGGRIVGTYLLLFMDKLSNPGAPAAVVDDVVVAPDRQGAGIGATMMHDAMARARQRGCYKLMLSSNLKRRDAHRFYEQLGFTQHGVSFEV
jgi:GNAT superfamily N-acetyltransferase